MDAPPLPYLPMISLLHATRKRVERALSCKKKWIEAAACPDRVEHLFAIDPDDQESLEGFAGHRCLIVQEDGKGCVGAWNLAAANSRGDILVQLSDDWVPQQGWDLEFARRLGDVKRPSVLRVSDGHRLDDLLCIAIFTRAWLEQTGTFLSDDYFGVYSDDEFSFRAFEAGVVIDARDLIMEHEHPSFDSGVEEDETYRRQNSSLNYQRGREVFLRRNPEAASRWLHDGSSLRYYLPAGHEALERRRVLIAADAGMKNPVSGEWRDYARKANELFVGKKVHAKVFRATTQTLVRSLVSIRKSFRGRIGLSAANRDQIDRLVRELETFKGKDSDVRDSIQQALVISTRAADLLDAVVKKAWVSQTIDKELAREFRAQVKAQQTWWESVRAVSDLMPAGADRKLPEAYSPPPLKGGIPVYIISFNQVTYLRNMVRQLRRLEVKLSDIHVVDNQSTFPPLLDYLSELEGQGHRVHRMPRNLGPRGIFEPESGLNLPEVFAVTDPDLQFSDTTPLTFREDMLQIAGWCGVWKCGCALTLSDRDQFLDGDYSGGKTIAEWEKAYWVDPIPGWPSSLGGRPVTARGTVYRASVDTTFAVYVRDRIHSGFLEAVRVAECFEARHLPWYATAEEVKSGGSSEPLLLRDGRTFVRPSPAEAGWYRQRENSSTTSKMNQISLESLTTVTEPSTGYPFSLPVTSTFLQNWRSHIESGSGEKLFDFVRKQTRSADSATTLIDLGTGYLPLSLWAALRCEKVIFHHSDPDIVKEMKVGIQANRFEHCVTVSEGVSDWSQCSSPFILALTSDRLAASLSEMKSASNDGTKRLRGIIVALGQKTGSLDDLLPQESRSALEVWTLITTGAGDTLQSWACGSQVG